MFFIVNILFLAFSPHRLFTSSPFRLIASSPHRLITSSPHRPIASHYACARKKACKGTTKNAHTQEKREIFSKMIDKIYLIQFLTSAQAMLESRVLKVEL